MTGAITLYGIANCDQVRRARAWLDARSVQYRFHDFRKAGLGADLASAWLAAAGADALINRKGTTWRKLSDAERAASCGGGALALMIARPSVIKRPVLEAQGRVTVGFDEAVYSRLLQ